MVRHSLFDRLRKLEEKTQDADKRIDAVIFSILPACKDALPVFNDRATCEGKEFLRLEGESESDFTSRITQTVKEPDKIKLIWLHEKKETE